MNTNRNHTPGPWKTQTHISLDRLEIRDADGRRIAVCAMDFPMSAKTHDANARLIAAAPELLAALAEAVDELEQMHRHYYGNCPGGCPACVAIDKARAAIAKAEGRAAE